MSKPRVKYNSPTSKPPSTLNAFSRVSAVILGIGVVGYGAYHLFGIKGYFRRRKEKRMEEDLRIYMQSQEAQQRLCTCSGRWCECENKRRALMERQYREQHSQDIAEPAASM